MKINNLKAVTLNAGTFKKQYSKREEWRNKATLDERNPIREVQSPSTGGLKDRLATPKKSLDRAAESMLKRRVKERDASTQQKPSGLFSNLYSSFVYVAEYVRDTATEVHNMLYEATVRKGKSAETQESIKGVDEFYQVDESLIGETNAVLGQLKAKKANVKQLVAVTAVKSDASSIAYDAVSNPMHEATLAQPGSGPLRSHSPVLTSTLIVNQVSSSNVATILRAGDVLSGAGVAHRGSVDKEQEQHGQGARAASTRLNSRRGQGAEI